MDLLWPMSLLLLGLVPLLIAAYVWVLRNANVSAVNSEMVDHRMVVENLPLARAKP